MADLWSDRVENPAVAIDREFSAVKITRCLKTGVNTAGHPEQVSPVSNHTERPANFSRTGCCAFICVQPVDWPFSATLRRAVGQETTSLKIVWRNIRFSFHKKLDIRTPRHMAGSVPAHSLVEEGRTSWSYCLAPIC